jgi:hypothetical protein
MVSNWNSGLGVRGEGGSELEDVPAWVRDAMVDACPIDG